MGISGVRPHSFTKCETKIEEDNVKLWGLTSLILYKSFYIYDSTYASKIPLFTKNMELKS